MNTFDIPIEMVVSTSDPEIHMEIVTNPEYEMTAEGFISISGDHYQGEYVVTPRRDEEIVLETAEKYMDDDVTVLKVPYYVTSIESGGETAYIAQEA